MIPPLAGALLGLVLGGIAGSFLATLLARWPEGESVTAGRSHCPHCHRTLQAGELVPMVSHLVQRGRCRGCGGTIDPRQFGFEAAAAGIGAVALAAVPGPGGFAWALFGWLLLVLGEFDRRHLWLPDALTLPLLVLGLTAAAVQPPALAERAVGAAVGFAVLWLVAAGYRRWRGRDGLGGGDAKLLAGIGAWLGWRPLPLVLLAASLLGLLLVAVAATRGRAPERDTPLPFGTFLCAAALPAWLAAGVLGLL